MTFPFRSNKELTGYLWPWPWITAMPDRIFIHWFAARLRQFSYAQSYVETTDLSLKRKQRLDSDINCSKGKLSAGWAISYQTRVHQPRLVERRHFSCHGRSEGEEDSLTSR